MNFEREHVYVCVIKSLEVDCTLRKWDIGLFFDSFALSIWNFVYSLYSPSILFCFRFFFKSECFLLFHILLSISIINKALPSIKAFLVLPNGLIEINLYNEAFIIELIVVVLDSSCLFIPCIYNVKFHTFLIILILICHEYVIES